MIKQPRHINMRTVEDEAVLVGKIKAFYCLPYVSRPVLSIADYIV